MKRRSSLGKRRVSRRRRRLARPALEVLEARLLLSTAPAPQPVNQSVLIAVTLLVPPAGLAPVKPVTPTATAGSSSGDAVFLDSLLLHFGGGHAVELLHFPASGGGGDQEKPPPPEAASVPSSAPPSKELETEVFAGDFWSEPAPFVQEETATALMQMTEALVE
jgi:hypothetical protein